jgi:hypothetical protein
MKPEEGFIGKSLNLTLMSDSNTIEIRSRGHPSLEGERKPKRQTCIKKMEGTIILNLGAKTRINDVMEMEEHVFVVRFIGRKIYGRCLKEWTKENFEPVVGYPPHIMSLEKRLVSLGFQIGGWGK